MPIDQTRLNAAIKYLQDARVLIEYEASVAGNQPDREDLSDVAEDIGPILHTLESFYRSDDNERDAT